MVRRRNYPAVIELSTLVPIDYNPRSIGRESMEVLQNSIKGFSAYVGEAEDGACRLATSIVVNQNGNRVVGGNQRYFALLAMGHKSIHRDDITWVDIEPGSAKEKALVVMLNNEYAAGRYNPSMLDEMLSKIETEMAPLFEKLDFHYFDTVVEMSQLEIGLKENEEGKQLAGGDGINDFEPAGMPVLGQAITIWYETLEEKKWLVDRLGIDGKKIRYEIQD